MLQSGRVFGETEPNGGARPVRTYTALADTRVELFQLSKQEVAVSMFCLIEQVPSIV